VSEGLQYFELSEAAPDSMKSRLFYVTAPAGVVSPDPTNEHQVERWKAIDPELHVVSPEAFFALNPRFYLLHTTGSTDVLTGWLLAQGSIEKPVAKIGSGWLFEAEAPEHR
jgi:hypothetical protein